MLVDVLTPTGELQTFTVAKSAVVTGKQRVERARWRYVRKLKTGDTIPSSFLLEDRAKF